MHLRRLFSLFCVPAAAAAMLGGCIIQTSNPTGGSGTNGSGGSTTTTSVNTSSGVGGSGVGGSGSGGSGGGPSCVDASGVGTVADCEKIDIAPAKGAPSTCGMSKMDPPPGYGVCVRGYTIFTTGAADELDACLATIAVADACNLTPVQTCVDKIFADACDDPAIASTCSDLGKQCGADPFNVTKCTTDLRPFSNAGLKELEDCINMADPNLSCQAAYDGCYDQVLTF